MSVSFKSNLKVALNASHEALMRAAEIIGGMAESNAKQALTDQKAVDTGNLRNSVTHKTESAGKVVSVVVGTNVHYGPYIELGTGKYASGGRTTPWSYKDENGHWHRTSGQPARPYLRPSIEGHNDEYKAVVEQELKKG